MSAEMKAVLMSINSLHNVNIEEGLKSSELRTRPPKLKPPFKVYTYESGSLGRHKVVNEWICSDMETWRMCMGIPAHLSKNACVSNRYIWKYSNNGDKDITEMKISNLVIYDKPKELSEFITFCSEWEKEYFDTKCLRCKYYFSNCADMRHECTVEGEKPLTRPPQSWCYVFAAEKGGVE